MTLYPGPPWRFLPTPAVLSLLFGLQLFSRLVVGGTTLIAANTVIYEFVTWLPTFFVQQGLSIASSFKYFFLMTMGAPVGAAIGAHRRFFGA